MSENAKPEFPNPFEKYGHRLFAKPNGKILRRLVMALYDRHTYFPMQELNKLEFKDFTAALHMIAWCYQHGSRDVHLGELVDHIDRSSELYFRRCVGGTEGYDSEG